MSAFLEVDSILTGLQVISLAAIEAINSRCPDGEDTIWIRMTSGYEMEIRTEYENLVERINEAYKCRDAIYEPEGKHL